VTADREAAVRDRYSNERWREKALMLEAAAREGVNGAVNEALEQAERANRAEAELAAAREREQTLREALRAAPMPVRESTLKDDEWHERYGEWWHEHASEAALAATEGKS
jgi:hypothetical protein